MSDRDVDFSALLGQTLTRIDGDKDSDELLFHAESGHIYKMFHDQECCEHVFLEDICGDLSDLIGTPILIAVEVTNPEGEDTPPAPTDSDIRQTWTFYRISTIRGTVVLRWFGSSNGYYSEDVDFVEVTQN